MQPPACRGIRAVRVLWDIENVPIPSQVDTLVALARLQSWLQVHGLGGSGVDTRITTVYCPGKVGRFFNNGTAHVLDKAGVEQVFCSRKVEDADRKILHRLYQEAVVLTPAESAFVIISGDLDFNPAVGFLIARGFRVDMVCGGGATARTKQCFEINASRVHDFDAIVKSTSPAIDNGRVDSWQSAFDFAEECHWDLGDAETAALDEQVNHFCQWAKSQHQQAVASLIGKYYTVHPENAGFFRGHLEQLKGMYPELKALLDSISDRTSLPAGGVGSREKSPAQQPGSQLAKQRPQTRQPSRKLQPGQRTMPTPALTSPSQLPRPPLASLSTSSAAERHRPTAKAGKMKASGFMSDADFALRDPGTAILVEELFRSRRSSGQQSDPVCVSPSEGWNPIGALGRGSEANDAPQPSVAAVGDGVAARPVPPPPPPPPPPFPFTPLPPPRDAPPAAWDAQERVNRLQLCRRTPYLYLPHGIEQLPGVASRVESGAPGSYLEAIDERLFGARAILLGLNGGVRR